MESRERSRTETGPVIVFLGGLNSWSGAGSGEWSLDVDFGEVRNEIGHRIPDARFVQFSYAAEWIGSEGSEFASALYDASDTTDRTLGEHVATLDRLVSHLSTSSPGQPIVLVGFSLGGLVAAAWAGSTENVRTVAGLGLISAPIGGVSALGGLTVIPVVRSILSERDIQFGSSRILRDIQINGPWQRAIERGVRLLPTVAIENSADYLVNGQRICGQVIFPEWVRTVPLGRGAYISGLVPRSNCCWRDLGGWDRELRQTHNLILRSQSPPAIETRRWLVDRITRLIFAQSGLFGHSIEEHSGDWHQFSCR